jgi:hypothetical protein
MSGSPKAKNNSLRIQGCCQGKNEPGSFRLALTQKENSLFGHSGFRRNPAY